MLVLMVILKVLAVAAILVVLCSIAARKDPVITILAAIVASHICLLFASEAIVLTVAAIPVVGYILYLIWECNFKSRSNN